MGTVASDRREREEPSGYGGGRSLAAPEEGWVGEIDKLMSMYIEYIQCIKLKCEDNSSLTI